MTPLTIHSARAFPAICAAFLPFGLAGAHQAQFEEYGLTLTIPALTEMQESLERADQRLASWYGKLGETDTRIELYVIDDAGASEPGNVTEMLVDFFRRKGNFDVKRSFTLAGGFGYASFVSCAEATQLSEGEVVAHQFILGGLLEAAGYALYVRCDASLDEAGRAVILEFFEKGVAYEGAVRDANWTDEEAQARWLRDAPEGTHEEFVQKLSKSKTAKKALIRTDNYLIMTNSSSGKLFAKQMEENYKEIKKTFPFEDTKGQRLMPVFLFQTPDEYFEYYAKIAGTSLENARKSKGHAWKDYYATWYEAPKDPVHIHEAVHQIFGNRLLLNGGGSWLQEGVAEYVETSENDRNMAARQVKKGEHTPPKEFVQLDSLLYSSKSDVSGANAAGDAYKQAALLIEFLRESKFGKEKFVDFLYLMGRVQRGKLDKIEEVFQTVYGMGVEEIDARFQEYCEDR
jgi:hypothetical protein